MSFTVYAFHTCCISGAIRKWELVKSGNGFVFKSTETEEVIFGTYTEKENKFEALDKFKHIYQEMCPRFELV